MAAIIDRGETRGLYIKFRDPAGKQHLVKVEGGQKAAEKRRDEIVADLVALRRSGEIHWRSPEERARMAREAEERARAESVKVSDYVERWLEDVAKLKVRARVHSGYAYALRKVWVDAIGDVELGAVTRRQINDVVSKLAAEKKAASTIRNTVKPLAAMFRYAVEEDQIIATNPAARIRIPTEAKDRRRRIVPPTREQVDKLVKAATVDGRDAILIASTTGLRRGEVFGLRWGDVDFEKRLIHVRRSVWGRTVDTPKSEAGARRVPLFESTRKALAARKLRAPERFSGPDDYIFAEATGHPVNPYSFVKREFKGAMKTAGIAEGAFRWHDLRHFAVSSLIAERADVKLLQAIAGHASATMTLDTYGHLMTERVEEAAKLYDPLREAVNG